MTLMALWRFILMTIKLGILAAILVVKVLQLRYQRNVTVRPVAGGGQGGQLTPP